MCYLRCSFSHEQEQCALAFRIFSLCLLKAFGNSLPNQISRYPKSCNTTSLDSPQNTERLVPRDLSQLQHISKHLLSVPWLTRRSSWTWVGLCSMQRPQRNGTEWRSATNQQALPCIWTRALKYCEHSNKSLQRFFFLITIRKRKQKIFANAQLLSSILLVACSEDDRVFHSLTAVNQRKDEKMNYASFCFSIWISTWSSSLSLSTSFPRQLWQALWEQWEMPGMGLSLWFLGSVQSTAAGQQGISCCHLPGSNHALCSLEGRGQQKEEREQKECLGANWLKSSSPCEPVNLLQRIRPTTGREPRHTHIHIVYH